MFPPSAETHFISGFEYLTLAVTGSAWNIKKGSLRDDSNQTEFTIYNVKITKFCSFTK